MRALYTAIILSLCIQGSVQPAFKWKTFQWKKFSKDFAHTYATEWAALIAHECAHAALIKLFDRGKFDINLGAEGTPNLLTGQNKARLFGKQGLGKPPVTLHGIFPIAGWANARYIYKKDKVDIKKAIISLAGPLAGAATYFLINLITYAIQYKHESLDKKLLWSFFDTSLISHLITNLMPHMGNDGHHIVEALMPSSKKLLRSPLYNLCALIVSAVIHNFAMQGIVLCQNKHHFASKNNYKQGHTTSGRKPGNINFTDRYNTKLFHHCTMFITHKLLYTMKGAFQGKINVDIDIVNDTAALALLYKVFPDLKRIYGG